MTSFFISSIDPLSYHSEEIKRIWRVLTLASEWGSALLAKIMCCFHWVQKKQDLSHPILSSDPLEDVDDQEFLEELFNQPVDYETFRNKILNYKNWFYNNYGFDAFSQLKEADWSIFDNCKNEEEKELKASMVVYDAIVDLYIKRFLDRYPDLNNEKYLPSLRIIALAIAIKISWDEAIENMSFRQFITPYMGVKQHTKMELEFLKAIDWNTSISELSVDYQNGAFKKNLES